MGPYDQDTRHLIIQEHIGRLARDYRSIPRDRRRRGRLQLLGLLGARAYRRLRNAQPARA
jgi:hypothetical protein